MISSSRKEEKSTTENITDDASLAMLRVIFKSPGSRMSTSNCSVSLRTYQIFTSNSKYSFLFRIEENSPYLLADPTLCAMAEKHKQTPALISLRYLLQRGVVTIAKSFNEKRIKENMKVRSRLRASGRPRSFSQEGLFVSSQSSAPGALCACVLHRHACAVSSL